MPADAPDIPPVLRQAHQDVQDELKVHMLLEATLGGELFRYLDTQPGGKFPEDWCRFYAACVVLALEHMHSQGIVYRDLAREPVARQRRAHQGCGLRLRQEGFEGEDVHGVRNARLPRRRLSVDVGTIAR